MISSMTGYGQAVLNFDDKTVRVEIKSVNHRYFEFSARYPRAYSFLEEKLKNLVKSKVSRGKIECFVNIDALQSDVYDVEINVPLLKGYINAFAELQKEFNIQNDASASVFSRIPEMFLIKKEEADEELIWAQVEQTASAALDKFIEMRKTEGEKMAEDISGRAEAILKDVEFVEKKSPECVEEYTFSLNTRIKEIVGDIGIDAQRILTEAALYADKTAVAEETVRLRSHLDQLKVFLKSDEPVGRKLDFLVQEINREANTIGSKSQNLQITEKVLNIKSEVEKIREQIQNIE